MPAGGTVSVDGNKYGTAPISVPGLSTGEHLVAAMLVGCEEARRTVTLLEQEPRTTVDLKLEPTLGLVLIRTDPQGADVQIDGADRGKTPMFLADIPVGKHRVKLSIPGYQAEITRSEMVKVRAKDRNGKLFRKKASNNLLAHCMEHEIDHLNGILYIDHLKDTDELVKTENGQEE